MKSIISAIAKSLLAVVALGLALVALWPKNADNLADMGIAAAAKIGCSGVFVMGRDLDEVKQHDLKPLNSILLKLSYHLDRPRNRLSVSLLGLRGRTALYREGLGCTLISDGISEKNPYVTSPRDCAYTQSGNGGQGLANG